jgi:hypothetical protein
MDARSEEAPSRLSLGMGRRSTTSPGSDGPGARQGLAVALAATIGAGTMLIWAQPNGETAYLPGAWVELVGLTVGGLVLLFRRVRRTREIACGVSLVLAAQLAGSAIYAFRRWVPIGGFGGGVKNIVLVRAAATTMAVAMVIASLMCLSALLREGGIRNPFPRAVRAFVLGAGAGVVCGLPLILGDGRSPTTDLTSIGAYAILYSIPFGGALIATAWLADVPAFGVLGTIAVGATLAIPWQPTRTIVEIHDSTAGFLLVVIAVGLVGLVRILGERGADASLLDSPGPTAPP